MLMPQYQNSIKTCIKSFYKQYENSIKTRSNELDYRFLQEKKQKQNILIKYKNVQALESKVRDEQTTQKLSLMKSRSSISMTQGQLIARYKQTYLNNLEQFYLHIKKGLSSIEEKCEQLRVFKDIYLTMIDSLQQIVHLIKQIDFDVPNFEEVYQQDPEYFQEIIYRDIKYLEQTHSELIYGSGLRYLNTVLQLLDIEEIDLEFDLKNWVSQGMEKIKYTGTLKRSFRTEQKTFFQKYICCCIKRKK
ncbi:hypothetical protein pb186bvf_019459 [Paramecium bursaria]